MFNRGKKSADVLYGAILDIGSGSVGGALVSVDHLADEMKILFETRTPIASSKEEGYDLRAIKEALLSVSLELGNTGLKTLSATDPAARVKTMYINISAPWAHTVSRSIEYNTDEKVKLSSELITELSKTAEGQAMEILMEDTIASTHNLSIINRATIALSANGYPITPSATILTDNIALTHTSSLVDSDLLKTLTEVIEPVFSDVELLPFTFMFVYYQTLSTTSPAAQNACLIDITAAATEIGVVKDGVLLRSTHMELGSHTVAEEIATACGIPISEALTYIRSADTTTIPEAVGKQIEISVIAYMKELSRLLTTVSDQLSVPEALFLHTNVRTEHFFSTVIKTTFEKVTKTTHVVHPIVKNLLKSTEDAGQDTALLLGARFFHTTEQDRYLARR